MKNTELMNTITRTVNRAGLTLKKHSPEILLVTGVVGAVASAVVACKATTKLSSIVESTKTNAEEIHRYAESEERIPDYTDEDVKKDLAITYVKGGLQVAKLYAPAVAFGALSVTAILASHNILKKRNVALAAAYTALDKSFKSYRNRVLDRFGEEVERQIRYNIQTTEVEETVVDEKGKEKKVTKTVESCELDNPYAVMFDECNPNWERDPNFNLNFLRSQQNYFDMILKTKGHVFLNDVLAQLGYPKTPEGQIVGWVYDLNNEKLSNYVDFGLMDKNRERVIAFLSGAEPSIILNFNVDGDIWSLMDTKEYANKF